MKKLLLGLSIIGMTIMLAGCGLPVGVGIAGAGLGAADVLFFHGCIGVNLSNIDPWNWDNQYECKSVGGSQEHYLIGQ